MMSHDEFTFLFERLENPTDSQQRPFLQLPLPLLSPEDPPPRRDDNQTEEVTRGVIIIDI